VPEVGDSIDPLETIVDSYIPCMQPKSIAVAYIVTHPTSETGLTSELYDSGATRHMTPYQQALVNCAAISPKPINAANQLMFCAIRSGNLPIHVPNGPNFSNIMLRDVLYTPDITQTLVSIGLIDNARYTMTFTGGTCIIRDACKRLWAASLKWRAIQSRQPAS